MRAYRLLKDGDYAKGQSRCTSICDGDFTDTLIPYTAHKREKGRAHPCTLVYVSVYYLKSMDQGARNSESNGQASLEWRIKRSRAYFGDQSNFLIAIADGSTGHIVVTIPCYEFNCDDDVTWSWNEFERTNIIASLVGQTFFSAVLDVLYHQHAKKEGLRTIALFCVQVECNQTRKSHETQLHGMPLATYVHCQCLQTVIVFSQTFKRGCDILYQGTSQSIGTLRNTGGLCLIVPTVSPTQDVCLYQIV